MKTGFTIITAILIVGSVASFASAADVPSWIKNNAGWWADGTISESEFVLGIQFLIEEEVLTIPTTTVSSEGSEDGVPEWVKNNAGWWAEGIITDNEFINGIQHLIKIGIINVSSNQEVQKQSTTSDEKLQALQEELEKCSEIKRAYDRLNCEKETESEITQYQYEQNAQTYQAGPVTYYFNGPELEIMESGQALLIIKMLAVNSGFDDQVSLMCSGPAVCNYDVSDGSKVYKYSSTDFTSGNITLKPGQAREFEIMFGPNIGYGGTTFEYDPAKDYVFRINESFGSASIPLSFD